MKKNIALLTDTMDYIEAHPDEWDQHNYRSCFAAHAAQLSGARFIITDLTDYTDGDFWRVVSPVTDTTMPVWEFATSMLGLTPGESTALFAGDNDIEMLRTIVDAWMSIASHDMPALEIAAA